MASRFKKLVRSRTATGSLSLTPTTTASRSSSGSNPTTPRPAALRSWIELVASGLNGLRPRRWRGGQGWLFWLLRGLNLVERFRKPLKLVLTHPREIGVLRCVAGGVKHHIELAAALFREHHQLRLILIDCKREDGVG